MDKVVARVWFVETVVDLALELEVFELQINHLGSFGFELFSTYLQLVSRVFEFDPELVYVVGLKINENNLTAESSVSGFGWNGYT